MPGTLEPLEAKKQLEAMAGHELGFGPEQVAILRYATGAHNTNDGIVASQSVVFVGKFCTPSPLLDASGATTTGAAGNVTFFLSDVVCLPLVRSLAEPINVLATARSSTPCYVTSTYALVAGTDVQLTLSAWDAVGKPAPNVPVHWRCRLVSSQIIG